MTPPPTALIGRNDRSLTDKKISVAARFTTEDFPPSPLGRSSDKMMTSSLYRFITSCASISVTLFLLQQQSAIFTLAAECVSVNNVCTSWGDPYRPLPG
eukprot:scaffold8079_cov70-Skeletonema_marinoi.AAC.2